MKVFLMVNNWVGSRVLRWMLERETCCLVGVALHPPELRQCDTALRTALADFPAERIFDASALKTRAARERIAALKPEAGVSAYFGYILGERFRALFPRGIFNLHPAMLPYNRGAHPNVWSIVEGTPAGVTVHLVDGGVDTGPIVAQRETPVYPTDTGAALYHRLERDSLELFRDTWPTVEAGTYVTREQPPDEGTEHKAADLATIDELNPDAHMRVGDVINILRARTFPPYPSSYITVDGKRVFVRVELDEDVE